MSMLKRVGDAIESQMAEDDNDPESLARAALMAMREPTDVEAHEVWGVVGQEMYQPAWTAMIDTILSEQPSPTFPRSTED